MIYHLLRELQQAKGRPVAQHELEGYALQVLPMAEHNVGGGLKKLAAVGLVEASGGNGPELWRTRGDEPPEVIATRLPKVYTDSFWYFLISRKVAGRPLPPQEVIRILRDVGGDSVMFPPVRDVLRYLEAPGRARGADRHEQPWSSVAACAGRAAPFGAEQTQDGR
jgi:hypothetical protein